MRCRTRRKESIIAPPAQNAKRPAGDKILAKHPVAAMGSPMQKMGLLGCVGLLLLVGVIVVSWGVSGYNRLNTLSNDVDGKWANVQSSYQRRNDLIPNLVNTVQGVGQLREIHAHGRHQRPRQRHEGHHRPEPRADRSRAARRLPEGAGPARQFALAAARVGGEIPRTEPPRSGFRDLQAQIEGTENRINVARNDFNDSTQAYNTQRNAFPTVLYANLVGMKEKPFFKADEAAQSAPKLGSGTFDTPAPARHARIDRARRRLLCPAPGGILGT